MRRDRLNYFTLRPELPGNAPGNSMHYADEKGELFVGPHVRISGFSGMVCIDSEDLALKYAEGCRPIFQKRYGADTKVEVVSFESSLSQKLVKTINDHSEIVRKRIATGNFAPNKKP